MKLPAHPSLKALFSPIHLLLTLSIIIFFAFGLFHLSRFVTADEHYWLHERIPQYWNAFNNHVWKKTLINDKPGVSLALVSGVGLFFEPHPETHDIKNTEKLEIYETERTQSLLTAFRLPLLIFNAFFLLYLFFIVATLTRNRWIALWTTAATALSPILIGISQIVNPDALLWSFGTGAFFTYLITFQNSQKKYVILTALLLGFALLSKYTATIFYPFFLFFLILHHIFQESSPTTKKTSLALKHHIFNYIAIVAGSIATICLFVPAVIARPHNLLELLVGFSPFLPWIYGMMAIILLFLIADTWLFGSAALRHAQKLACKSASFFLRSLLILVAILFLIVITAHRFLMPWKLFTSVPFDIKDTSYLSGLAYIPNFFETILLNIRPLTFSIPPLLLFLTIGSLLYFSFFKKRDSFWFLAASVTCFLFFFLTANALAGVITTIRYSILLYPLVAFLSALGLWHITQKFSLGRKKLSTISLLFIAFLTVSIWLSKPFYFNYTNELLPKETLITDSWGYGGYEAAQYINSQTDAEKLIVWSDYFGVCEFIKGTCITTYKYPANGKYAAIDYYVTTRRGKIRYNPEHVQWRKPAIIHPYAYYDQPNPAWELLIDKRPENYVRIYKAERREDAPMP